MKRHIAGTILITTLLFKSSVYGLIAHPVKTYDKNVDYRAAMYRCATLGDECSMAMGHVYEIQRNMKLTDLGKDGEKTFYFHPGKLGSDIVAEMVSDKMRKEYDTAGYIYEQLSKAGYTDAAVAGILGNMMNETGGNTLNLNPYIYEVEYGMHYGLCQWSVKYFQEVNGASLEDQVSYLITTMEEHLTPFGGSLDGLKECETAEDAARYFSIYYERGGNTTQRKKNAKEAYEWIMKFKE